MELTEYPSRLWECRDSLSCSLPPLLISLCISTPGHKGQAPIHSYPPPCKHTSFPFLLQRKGLPIVKNCSFTTKWLWKLFAEADGYAHSHSSAEGNLGQDLLCIPQYFLSFSIQIEKCCSKFSCKAPFPQRNSSVHLMESPVLGASRRWRGDGERAWEPSA